MSTTLLVASGTVAQAQDLRLDEATRQAMIAEAAYFLSESRGFEPGWELEDWLNAEWEVDQRLASYGIEVPLLRDPA